MNKKIILLSVFFGGTLLSGCSSFGPFDGRTLWGSQETKAPSVQKTTDKATSKSLSDSNEELSKTDKLSPKSLSEYQITSFPAWFDPDLYQQSHWEKITLQSGLSFAENLSNQGIDTKWLSELRRRDYIDLSTTFDDQTVWFELDERSRIVNLYTVISPNQAYYISLTESGPVMSRGAPPLTLEGSFYVRPGTQVSELSDIQRLALKKYLDRVVPQISHEEEVIISMGATQITFAYDRLQSNQVGKIWIKSATSWFEDYVMVYKPE